MWKDKGSTNAKGEYGRVNPWEATSMKQGGNMAWVHEMGLIVDINSYARVHQIGTTQVKLILYISIKDMAYMTKF